MNSIFVLLVVYQVKHFLADYPLQTPYMLKKFSPGLEYLKPLAAHAGVHAIFTCVVAILTSFWIPVSLMTIIAVTLFDFTIHFVMDRIKASPKMLGRYKALASNDFKAVANHAAYDGNNPELRCAAKTYQRLLRGNTYFWWALGLDQAVHHLTHYVIIYCLVV